ncbi:MAG: ABC transporter ATP-binding protein/permease [Acidimicrobiia bacterium]|nr:ABC transporter ATP-binding protein/permease [Acidimicrobiia bacterium]MDH5238214.1 ABC transporter ATP-binding protein/permease [Acidimicrobiia bacterium]
MAATDIDAGVEAVPHLFRRGLRLIGRSLRARPRAHAIAITGAFVFAVAAVALTRVLGWATDQVIIPGLDGEGVGGDRVWAAVALIMGVGVFRGSGALVRRYYLAVAEYGTQHLWRRQLFDRYLDLPLSFFQSRPTGELLAHADNDLTVSSMVLKPLAFTAGTFMLGAFSLISLWLVHPLVALIALVLFPLLAIMNQMYTARVEVPSALVQERVGDVSSIAHESFDGVLVVKALGREAAEVAHFEEAADRLRRERIGVGRLRATFEPAIDSLPNLGIIGLLAMGAWLIDQGSITVGELVASMALFTILALPVRIVGFFLEEMPKSVVALERIDRVLDEPVPDPEGERDRVLADGPLEVRFDGVHLDYDGHPVLKGVTFAAHPGEAVAIVGSTGGGKSSLARLLVDLMPVQRGGVSIGGVSVSDLDRRSLHEAVALAFQETFLFATTIRDNIALDRPLEEGAVEEAARVAGAHRFIMETPEGYDTVVGERGVTLSGGQRQRVALARALVANPRVLFLDDATSAVDPVVEAEILDNLRHELRLTLLVVAHRLSTIRLADRVVFIADGRVRAEGTHDELLRVPAYEALVRAYEEDGA